MVLSVGYVKRLAVESHSLRMVEGGLSQLAIGQAFFSAANDLLHATVQFRDNDAVVIGVGYKKSIS